MKIRFRKYAIRPIPEPRTPRRIAAAEKAIEKDRQMCGMFPEMMRFKTVEERLSSYEKAEVLFWSQARRDIAESWLKSRRILRSMPEKLREDTLLYWNQYTSCPAESYYLADILTQIQRGLLDPEKKIQQMKLIKQKGQNTQ